MKTLSEMLKLLPGLRLKILVGKCELTPGENGFLDKFSADTSVLLTLSTANPAMRVFTVDGNKTIVPSKNHRSNQGEGVYKLNVHIMPGDHFPFTRYPNNNIRVMTSNHDRCQIFEIAIIGQSGSFFLAIQRTFEFQVFKDRGKLVCPAHAQWTSLIKYLTAIYSGRIRALSDVKCYQPTDNIKPEIIPIGTAIVKWWDNAMQYGCAYTLKEDKVVPARFREIEAFKDNMITFEPGEIVGIDGCIKLNSELTNFEYEVSGVTKLDQVPA